MTNKQKTLNAIVLVLLINIPVYFLIFSSNEPMDKSATKPNELIGQLCQVQTGDLSIRGKIKRIDTEWVQVITEKDKNGHFNEFWIPRSKLDLILKNHH